MDSITKSQPQIRDFIPDYLQLFSIAGFVVVLDQVSKVIVRRTLALGQVWSPIPELTPIARIVHWKNTGAAFGFFQNGNLIFTVLAFIVSILIINYFIEIPRKEKFLRIAISLQMGGAIGNLIDRLNVGWVTDFLSVGSFPVFNIADSSISIGVVVLLIPLLPELKKEIPMIRLYNQVRQIRANYQKQKKIFSFNEVLLEKPISLGILEIIIGSVTQFDRLYLTHRAKKIKTRFLTPHNDF